MGLLEAFFERENSSFLKAVYLDVSGEVKVGEVYSKQVNLV